MKHFSRIVPILTVLLLAGCTPASSQTAPDAMMEDPFSDVPETHAYAEAIYYLRDNGIVEGYPDGSFKPEARINRAEFLKIIAESTFNTEYIEDCDVEGMSYPDVPASEWFAEYVCAGSDAGLVEGYPDGSFQPANNINFVEAAKIVSNSREIPVMGEYTVWYQPYVENLAERNAIPMSITSFDQLITRAQMSEMIYRLHAGVTTEMSQTYMTLGGDENPAEDGQDVYKFHSNVTVTMDEEYVYVESNGIPDHETGEFPNPGNLNTISAQDYSLQFPRNPVKGDVAIDIKIPGIAVDGVIFDPGTAERWEGNDSWAYEALQDEIDLGLDHSNAHVQPSGAYHYHGIPEILVEQDSAQSHSSLVGFAADGFPLYVRYGSPDGQAVVDMTSSWRLKSGQRPSDGPPGEYDGTFTQDFEYMEGSGELDECNGGYTISDEFPSGTYAYFLTDSFPYIPRCVMSQPDSSFSSLQNAGAPTGGGPGGGGPPPHMHQ